jgi:OmpA-OmpF porin, OOP family
MNIIDPLLQEATERFSLGNGASPLFSSLLSLIVNPQNGGIAGFFSRFQQAGLGNLVSSWMGNGDNNPVSANQLEQALGGDTLDRLAASAGLPVAAAAPAMAFMLPKVMNLLTPDGVIPNVIPAWASAYLPASLAGLAGAGSGFTERKIERPLERSYSENYPDPGVETSRRSSAAVIDRQPVEPDRKEGGGWWKWLLPLLLLGLLGWLFAQFLGRKPEPAIAPVATAPAAPAAADVNPTLSLNNVDGTMQYSGVVRDDATKTTILDNLKQAFGDKVKGDITVNPAAKAAAWLPGLGGALAALNLPGAALNIDGNAINLGGNLPAADKTAMLDKLKTAFGSQFQFGDGAAASAAAPTATTETVKSLNLDNINFETGSAEITADSMSVIEKDAEAIKAMPAGTKIEIGGHTDNTGDPNFNTTLSDDRANAVKDELVKLGVDGAMLTAKGYGSEKAIADNNTEEGRLKNRRIEFVVAP